MASGLASGSKEIVTCKGALPGNWQGFFVDEVRLADACPKLVEGFCGYGLGGSRGSGGRYCYLQLPLLALRDFRGRSSPG